MPHKPFVVRSDAQDLSGKCYGDLRVVRLLGRKRYPSGQSHLMYEVFCTGCGRVYEAHRSTILRSKGGCKTCTIKPGSHSFILPDGRNLYFVAQQAGLPMDTVYHRFKRGWPLDQLTLPRRTKEEAVLRPIGTAKYQKQRKKV